MAAFWQDVRYATRTLRKAPRFTALAVVLLALGIGANSAMFSLVDAALVRPLPFSDAEDLVMLWERSPADAYSRVAPLNFRDWSEQNHTVAMLAAVAGGDSTLMGASGSRTHQKTRTQSAVVETTCAAPRPARVWCD